MEMFLMDGEEDHQNIAIKLIELIQQCLISKRISAGGNVDSQETCEFYGGDGNVFNDWEEDDDIAMKIKGSMWNEILQ